MFASTSVALVTSLCTRGLIAGATGSLSAQVAVFSALDMAISSIASSLFIQKAQREGQYNLFTPLLTGRIVGFVAAASIATVVTGMVDVSNLMLVSGVSQTVAFFVWHSLPYESTLFIG